MKPSETNGLARRIAAVCEEGRRRTERLYQTGAPGFDSFIAADYRAVSAGLADLAGRAVTFLECGAGLGVITIIADLFGFEAVGIEHRADLVAEARSLAADFDSEARFFQGNFIPEGFDWDNEFVDADTRLELAGDPAYPALDLELRDFDLVYAYPWPGELPLLCEIMAQCGRSGSLLMTYDASDGVELRRIGPEIHSLH